MMDEQEANVKAQTEEHLTPRARVGGSMNHLTTTAKAPERSIGKLHDQLNAIAHKVARLEALCVDLWSIEHQLHSPQPRDAAERPSIPDLDLVGDVDVPLEEKLRIIEMHLNKNTHDLFDVRDAIAAL